MNIHREPSVVDPNRERLHLGLRRRIWWTAFVSIIDTIVYGYNKTLRTLQKRLSALILVPNFRIFSTVDFQIPKNCR